MMRFSTTVLFLLICFSSNAQIEKEPIPAPEISAIQFPLENTIVGKVIEFGSGKPVEAASVQLFAHTTNEYGQSSDSLIDIVLTRPNGDFDFTRVPAYDSLKVVVSSIGHTTATYHVPYSASEKSSPIRYDIGNIILPRETQRLEGIVITAITPKMKLGIDKKVFDVGQNLTAKGGTAVDVMKTIPSLNVDLDGNVEFRNGSPTIYVDGRPTILTLDQIPSDNIEQIELISNPSAKYDASSGGGIINIILKKDKRRGFNGLVSLTGGTPEVFRTNANLNLRQGKLNFFLSGSYNTSGGKSKGSSDRTNRENGFAKDYFSQQSINDRSREFKSLRGGLDYFIDNRNTLSFSQGYTQGDFTNNEKQDQQYLDLNKNLLQYGVRNSLGGFQFRRNSSQMNYTHKFPRAGEEINASLNVNYGGVDNHNRIVNSFFYPDGTPMDDMQVVRNEGSNNNNQWTAKIDFTNPINENKKIETGLRSYVNNYESLFNTFGVNGNTETKLPLSNQYKYEEQVHAAYFTFTNRIGNFGYQLGLRGEYSKFDGTLIDSAQHFGYEYPSSMKNIWDALFPSIFLSQKLSEKSELQINYSRRVRRPNFWQLNPFVDINDPQNIQQGNPALKPEFRNSYELNYSLNYGSNSNFLAVMYYRNTQDDITRYSDTLTAKQYEQLNNSAVDPNAILNTYINANSTNNLGIELILQQKFSPVFDITPSVSLAYRKVHAEVKSMDLSNEGFNWQTKLQVNYRLKAAKESSLFNNLSLQLDGEYESPRVIPQGKRLENYSVDLALRKDIFKNNRGSIVFSVNDLFDTNRRGVIYDTPAFYQESYSRWRVRSFRLTFSYKFGDANFQLFKRNGGGGGDDFD